MTITQFLQLITQGTVLLIAALTGVEFLRHRDRARLDVMLLFVDFAVIVIMQLVGIADQPGLLTLAVSILLMAHPYLLMRLVEHFATIPPLVHWVAQVGLILSAIVLALIPPPYSPGLTLALVLYFVVIEVYATLSFVRGAMTTTGVTHWRLLLVALGSGLLALMLGFSGINVILPQLETVTPALSQVIATLAMVSYYFGFATPNWLRRQWQLSELHKFLSKSAGQWINDPLDKILERLGIASTRSVGGIGSASAIWDERLREYRLFAPTMPMQVLGDMVAQNPIVERAVRQRKGILVYPLARAAAGSDQVAQSVGARAALAAPIATRDYAWGVHLVFLRQAALFASDDLALLSLFAEQVSLALSYNKMLSEQRALIDQLTNSKKRLEGIHEIDRALLSAQSPQAIARAALARLRNLVPCESAKVVLFAADTDEIEYLTTEPGGAGPADGTRVRSSDFLIPDVTRRRSVILIEDARSLPTRSARMDHAIAQGTLSFLAVPLIVEQKPIGTLVLAGKDTSGFGKESREIASEIADQLAVTLEQARLRQELERHAGELERRVAERTAELQVANKELEAFSYSVSHDLRSPLAAIDGFSRLVLRDYKDNLPPDGQRFLELVRKNTLQMDELIQALLDFSRLARQPLNRETVQPEQLAMEVVEDLRAQNNGRQIQVDIKPLRACQADPILLRQVFANLLSNAFKFTRNCAQPRIEVSAVEKNGETVYSISDNGAGFDMDQAERLFAVFQRLHHAEEFEGTGIGLAIVQRIIQRHGGRIWAEGEVSRGATFYFTIGSG